MKPLTSAPEHVQAEKIAIRCGCNAMERSSPVIVTSDRIGLPESRHPDTIQILTSAPAPAPDMTSQAVLAAQPKSGPEALERIKAAAHRTGRGGRSTGVVDKFSISGQEGGPRISAK
jgi:hypothetical protein